MYTQTSILALLSTFAIMASATPAPTPVSSIILPRSTPITNDWVANFHRAFLATRGDGNGNLPKRSCDSDGCSSCEKDCNAFSTGPYGGIAAGLCILQCPNAYGCNDYCA